MPALVYTNPQGQTDSSPFPTGANRYIYAQEVNNMFEQVRQHINGQLGTDNFVQPFTSSISFNLSTGSALDIITSSGASAISVAHNTTNLGPGVSLIDIKSTASNTNNGSALLSIEQDDATATIPLIRLVSKETTLPVPFLHVSVDGSTNVWTFEGAADAAEYDVVAGFNHRFKVDGAEVFAIAATVITSAVAIDAPVFTAGSSSFQDESLDLNGPILSRVDGTTFDIANNLRFGGATGPTLSKGLLAQELLINDILTFNNTTDGPRLSRITPNRLRIEREIELNDGVSAVVITPTSAQLNVDTNTVAANGLAAIVSATITPFKIIRGNVDTLTNSAVEGEGFTVQATYAGDGTRIRLTFDAPFASTPTITTGIQFPGGNTRWAMIESFGVGEVTFVIAKDQHGTDFTDGIVHFMAIGGR